MVETRSQKKKSDINIENAITKKRKQIKDISDSESDNDYDYDSEIDEDGNLKDFIDDSDLKKKIKKIIIYDINNLNEDNEDDEYDTDGTYDPDDSDDSDEALEDDVIDIDNIYKYSKDETNYVKTLTDEEKEKLDNTIEKLKLEKAKIPLKIKILLSDMDINVKKIVLENYLTLQQLSISADSSYCKLKKWFDALMMVPFGMYRNIDVEKNKNSDKEINDHIDPSLGVRFVQRPEKFNKNSATFSIIMDKAIGLIDTEYVLYFCVTSPFIKVETIADMIDKVQNCNYDSAIAVKKIKNFCWFDSSPLNYDPHNVPFTQDLQPVFEETSGLYLFKKDLYLKTKRRCGFNPYLKVVNDVEGHDIDYEEDFNLAKFYLENDLI